MKLNIEKNSYNKSIVYFDGVCVVCNGFMDFLLKWDSQDRFLVSPLQKSPASAATEALRNIKVDSIVLWKNESLYFKSQAVIHIFLTLGGVWKIFGLLLLIPAPLSDLVYDLVARFRYSWFGKKEACRLPTPNERKKFLS